MKLEVHVHVHSANEDAILALLKTINKKVNIVMTDLTRITEEVAENTSVIQSAIALLNDLAQQIRDNATDPAALEALADNLDANSNALGAAVAANTPGEEPPVDETEEG